MAATPTGAMPMRAVPSQPGSESRSNCPAFDVTSLLFTRHTQCTAVATLANGASRMTNSHQNAHPPTTLRMVAARFGAGVTLRRDPSRRGVVGSIVVAISHGRQVQLRLLRCSPDHEDR
jgi:hypothetical protein